MKKVLTIVSVVAIVAALAFIPSSKGVFAYSAKQSATFAGVSTTNTAAGTSIPVNGYRYKSVYILSKLVTTSAISAFVGTISVQCSNDGANWFACRDQNGNSLNNLSSPTTVYTINDGSSFIRAKLATKADTYYPYVIIRYWE